MGNNASSGRGQHEDTVDFGHLVPQGIYTGPRDWNQVIVSQLICERRLAPFYRPLEDYEESWDDERVLAARKEPPDPDAAPESAVRIEAAASHPPKTHHKRSSASKDLSKYSEAAIYRGAVECPICFLYYPPNINHSRCCDQAICTECFVQIKRAEPTATHLVSEPAACPYCVQDNFGVTYTPPPWRAGIGSDGTLSPSRPEFSHQLAQQAAEASNPQNAGKKRRRSFGADSREVVTIDQIRPDWEQKLAAVRAAVTRRANRRIIMRQVGDRLIPVGVTSGRVHALPDGAEPPGDLVGDASGGTGGRRSRRRQANQELNQLLGSMGLGGQDLEELMIMEAMRLSLIEQEEQQRRQAQANQNGSASQNDGAAAGSLSSSAPAATAPISMLRPRLGNEECASLSSGASPVQLGPSPLSRNWAEGSGRLSHDSAREPSGSGSRATHIPSAETQDDTSLSSSLPTSGPADSISHPLSLNGSTNAASSSTVTVIVNPTSNPLDAETVNGQASTDSVDAAPTPTPVPTTPERSSTPVGTAPVPDHPPLPERMQRLDSTSSSISASSVYDNLPSSPESTVSHAPLLESASDSTGAGAGAGAAEEN